MKYFQKYHTSVLFSRCFSGSRVVWVSVATILYRNQTSDHCIQAYIACISFDYTESWLSSARVCTHLFPSNNAVRKCGHAAAAKQTHSRQIIHARTLQPHVRLLNTSQTSPTDRPARAHRIRVSIMFHQSVCVCVCRPVCCWRAHEFDSYVRRTRN